MNVSVLRRRVPRLVRGGAATNDLCGQRCDDRRGERRRMSLSSLFCHVRCFRSRSRYLLFRYKEAWEDRNFYLPLTESRGRAIGTDEPTSKRAAGFCCLSV